MNLRSFGLLRYAAPYWRGWTVIALVTALSTALSLLQPWPMKILVDHVLGHAPATGGVAAILGALPGASTRPGLLAWVACAGVFIFAVNSLFDVVLTFTWTRVGRRMVYDVASDLFARLQRRSLAVQSRTSIGDAISRIAVDSWSVHTVVNTLLFTPGQALVTAIAIFVVMATIDAPLTMLALVVAPPMALSARMFRKPMRAAARVKREIESRLQSHVHQALSGIPVVQAFTSEAREERRFREFADQAIEAERQSILVSRAFSLSSGLLTTLGTSAVLWFAARRVLDGHLSLGSTLVFLTYLQSLQWQLATFGNTYKTLQTAGASIDRVAEVLEGTSEVPDPPGRPALPRARGAVRFRDVTFGYEADRPILKQVSLDVAPGERVAIVGATGSGKSTLVGLVPRFFDPWSGSVSIDGRDLRAVDLKSVREQVAVVFQEPFLLPLSVADNIAFARPNATRAEIEAAARSACAHEFISRLEHGYDTVLGERGATL